jgi:hypothetical protein
MYHRIPDLINIWDVTRDWYFHKYDSKRRHSKLWVSLKVTRWQSINWSSLLAIPMQLLNITLVISVQQTIQTVNYTNIARSISAVRGYGSHRLYWKLCHRREWSENADELTTTVTEIIRSNFYIEPYMSISEKLLKTLYWPFVCNDLSLHAYVVWTKPDILSLSSIILVWILIHLRQTTCAQTEWRCQSCRCWWYRL